MRGWKVNGVWKVSARDNGVASGGCIAKTSRTTIRARPSSGLRRYARSRLGDGPGKRIDEAHLAKNRNKFSEQTFLFARLTLEQSISGAFP